MPETRARFLANTIGATNASNDFTLPDGVGVENQVLSSDGAGGTTWATTLSAPDITSVTGSLNEYEDGVSEDGGVLTINGTNFGADPSALSVQISGTTGFAVIAETTTISITTSGTQFTATFTGAETNYNHSSFAAGSTIYVKVTKSGLQTSTYATLGTAMTGDPSFSTTSTTASTHTGTLPATSLGSYGGQIAGGGDDSNTKLLLNFDRTGGTDIEDSSNVGGDGHKVTANGHAAIKSSPFGDGKSAIFFNGSSDYLTVADTSDFDFGVANAGSSSAWTMECWFKETVSISDGASLFYWSTDSSSTDNYFQLYYVNATPKLYFNSKIVGTTVTNIVSDTTLELNKWYHVALVCDGAGKISMYLNGKLEGTPVTGYSADLDFSNTSSGSSGLVIGARKYGSTVDYYMGGYIDEIRIVKGTAVYTGDFNVPTSRLSATQSNQGTNIADITGTVTKLLIHSEKEDDASSHKRPVTATGAIQKTDQSKWGGSSWYSSGVTNVLDIPFPEIGTGDFTIDFWAYPQTPPGSDNDQVLIDTRIGGGNGWFISWHKTNNQWRLYSYDGTNTDNHTFGTVNSAVDGWGHVALQRSSGTMRLWVNGTQASDTLSSSSSLKVGNDGTIKIFGVSGNNNAHNWKGYLDELRISSVARYSSTDSITVPTGAYTSDDDTLLLLHGDGAFFDDSSDSNHNISATGSYHSQAHGGIAPALAFPASLKKNGSAGVYFDGNGDKLTGGTSPVLGTGDFAIDFWCWPSFNQLTTGAVAYVFDGRANASNIQSLSIQLVKSSLQLKVFDHVASSWAIDNASDTGLTANTWNHVQLNRSSGTLKLYIDGVPSSNTDTTNSNFSEADGFNIGTDYSGGNPFTGYIDNFRISVGTARETSNFSSSLPNKIYGAYRSQDVGTIQLNASAGTGGGALDYAELSGGTALSTYGLSLSSSGAITGTLTGLNNNSNSGGVIRIRARANADDNRVTTLGGASFTGITQNDGKAPVLFNARRYVGNGAIRDINGFGFQPDLVWIKNRDSAYQHQGYDSVRGGKNKILFSDAAVQASDSTGLTNFKADGFSVGSNIGVNENQDAIIAWAWKAGGAPTTDQASQVRTPTSGALIKDGSFITTTDYWPSSDIYPKRQSVSTTGDFSITRYTGTATGTNQTTTIPHGLSGTPDWVIVKNLDSANTWIVKHSSINSTSQVMRLDTNGSLSTPSSGYVTNLDSNHVTATSNTNSTAYGRNVNRSGDDFIMYAWKAVSGVSAFGTYEGSNTTSKIISDVGFVPSLLIIKNIDNTNNWMMMTNILSAGTTTTSGVNYNPDGNHRALAVNDSSAESSQSYNLAKTYISGSNKGFELTSTNVETNGNHNYIYMAFA